jgi:glycosyltransferase involved in cell wall biosynthesis
MNGEHAGAPMRVLYLSWRDRENPEAGGSEVFVERTSEVMSALGDEVTIHTARFPGAARRTVHGDVRVLRAGNRFTCYAAGLWHLLRHSRDYDVVIDVQNGVPFWSPIVSRVPVVAVVHHVHRDQWSSIFGERLARFGWFLESKAAPFVYRKSRYVTVSKATRAELVELGVDAERIDLVYSGNDHPRDLDSYADVPRTPEPSITVLGRLVPHKQVEIAVDTVARLRPQFPGLVLNVVGSGYWQENIARHARDLGVEDAVRFHGFVDEETKHTLLASSWLVMMPSYKEGWGLTIVEAGLHGTPSLAFIQAGGPSESIQHASTGALASTTDELIDDVRVLLERADVREELGRNARRYARSFSWNSAGRNLHHTLENVLGRATRAPQPPDTPLHVERLRALVERDAFASDERPHVVSVS